MEVVKVEMAAGVVAVVEVEVEEGREEKSRGMGAFTPLSRRTVRIWDLAMSLGPISRRRGTP